MAVTDPCAQYEDATGNINILALIEGTLTNVECIVKAAQTLTGGAPSPTAQAAQLAASQLRAAQQAHINQINSATNK